jgi:signal transduction histidine kinase
MSAAPVRFSPSSGASGLRFSTRLGLMLAGLLLLFAAVVAVLGRQLYSENEQEASQRLSRGLAQHIVDHWPQMAASGAGLGEQVEEQTNSAQRQAVLNMLMVVNPGVQVYVLNSQGTVAHYIGEPGMVRQAQVAMAPVHAFLAGADLPLRGTDPMAAPGQGVLRIFSAAMFAPRAGQTQAPGYLYVVLDGRARDLVAGQVSPWRGWRTAAWVAALGLLATWAVGAFALRRLGLPLQRVAAAMRDYSLRHSADHVTVKASAAHTEPNALTTAPLLGDEVQAIEHAFAGLTDRIDTQAAREREHAAAHREMMAGVAHDLRTPLTALHGHLEAMSQTTAPASTAAPASHERLLAAALSQSNKLRRLTQQLFELAALNASDDVLHRERFSLDELVTDAVQKFDLARPVHLAPRITLWGDAPGRLELDGDLQLIERALTNLIDNAMRHAPGSEPVRVSLRREGERAVIWVEDTGPGLPGDVVQRLQSGQSVRQPPPRRATTATNGGIGGLGLAIAQRVAVLHGGSLSPLPAPGGGTRLCLALPITT